MVDIEIQSTCLSLLKKVPENVDRRLLGGRRSDKERTEFPENLPLQLMTSLSRDVLRTSLGHQHNLDSVYSASVSGDLLA